MHLYYVENVLLVERRHDLKYKKVLSVCLPQSRSKRIKISTHINFNTENVLIYS